MVPSNSGGDDRSENGFFGEFVVRCLKLKVASRCIHEPTSAHGELKDDGSGDQWPGRGSMAAWEEAHSSQGFRELGFLLPHTDQRWLGRGAPIEVEAGLWKLSA